MKRAFILIISLSVCVIVFSQSEIKIMSYNVENLFDTKDDSIFNDSEYLRGGIRGWNYERYTQKLYNIAKVIVAAGEWEPPAIVGLCEIENYNVLYELIHKTGLENFNYNIIHYDSPDARGVDVGMLYLPSQFQKINSRPIRIHSRDSTYKTRDILYASGKLSNGDTLHIFVNHFPSRLGGELESEEKRTLVANHLRIAVDSLFTINSKAKILIMGDFNDMPDNKSIVNTLAAIPFDAKETEIKNNSLYNLTYKFHKKGDIGTYRFKNEWNMLDQIIVSGVLLDSTQTTTAVEETIRIFSPDWLLEKDKIFGFRPQRTYIGMTYNNGFSDHLPVVINLRLR